MTGAERADFDHLRAEVMSELRALRDEIKELRNDLADVRRDLDRVQGGLQLIKFVGPVGIAALFIGIAKAVGLF